MLVNTLHRMDFKRGDSPRDVRRTGLDPDFWYPLTRASELKIGKTLAVNFGGEPIVLARTETGEVFALEDRCAHRQVPLSLGSLKNGRLICSYHCWAYDKGGKCVNVPYLDDGKTLPNGVRSFPCREAHGFIFVFPGDATKADKVSFPDLPLYSDPHYKTRVLDRKIDCHYSFMHENLMDMNHQWLHRSLMGSIRTTLLDMREGEDWMEVDYTFSRASGKQPLGERFMINRSGTPDPSKGRDLMTIRTEYPYQHLRFWTAGSEEPALHLWNCYVPVDADQRRNHTFGLIMIRRPGIPGIIHLLWPMILWFTNGIFSQDKAIVEAEQRAHDEAGYDRNQEIFPAIQKLKELLGRRGVPLRSV